MIAATFRSAAVVLLAGLALLAGWWFVAASSAAAMQAYLAAWLVALALPLGALPWVMTLDLAGGPVWAGALAAPLRRMLWLLPVVAVLMVPILVTHGILFKPPQLHSAFGRWWVAKIPSIVRSVVYFFFWCALGLLFATPPKIGGSGRRSLAIAGLALYMPLITLASIDWAMRTEAGWFSPIFGLLFLTAQMQLALAAAFLLAGETWRRQVGRAPYMLLLVACTVWLYVQFIQFLVIWSANRPSDVTFYIHRYRAAGYIVEWIGFGGGFLIPVAVLGLMGWYRRARVGAAVATLLLLSQALEMFWLVTPSYRHHFMLQPSEVLGSLGLVALLLACALLAEAYRRRGAAHA